MQLTLKDTFNRELPADPNRQNTRRQVFKSAYSFVEPRQPSQPTLVHASPEMAAALGLTESDLQSEAFLEIFSGKKILSDSAPYAMCYGGHQFGHWAGQLGDGRAINLGEVVHEDRRWALQLKGSGETPYSRTADGLAVLRSSVREHLCSEAMHHLGVPTTRSLSLITTGDQVMRDMLYDGNAALEKGAVVCRVAPSFIRIGNFQIFASRSDVESLQQLADYTIRHFFPHIKTQGKEAYLQFFQEVMEKTLEMVIHWQRVGFVHGVMNTDNQSILGLTIDYGPYGWLDGYDPNWTPNTTDLPQKRYRFGQQPGIALWNLFQLANALFPLIEDPVPLEAVIKAYQDAYPAAYLKMMRGKLGLHSEQSGDMELVSAMEKVLQETETDMTIFFRELAKINRQSNLEDENDWLAKLYPAFYEPYELKGEVRENWKAWMWVYLSRLQQESASEAARLDLMHQHNPKYVLRNYMAQLAIDAANEGDFSVVNELYELLRQPYAEQEGQEKWYAKRPEWARHKVGCSQLSCSS
ncbi:MAG: YdiU family protein [Bacteroidota bacterium]